MNQFFRKPLLCLSFLFFLNLNAQAQSSIFPPIIPDFQVNDNTGLKGPGQYNPAIASNAEGETILVWFDYREGGEDIFGQRFAADGTPIGSNFRITLEQENAQRFPDVSLWNNRIYTAWQDDRIPATNFDIWTNVQDFDNPVGFKGNNPGPIPADFILQQNFPNPFNPSTKIRYQLPAISDVEIIIFDIAGRKVKTLVSKRLSAGVYEIEWDGTNRRGEAAASGLYLYRLKTGQGVKTRKMLLIR